jgi:hypothetical protein
MQPRGGRSDLPRVRRPRGLAWGWGRLLRLETARVNIGRQPTGRLDRYRRRRLPIRTDYRAARFGPTTPTRAQGLPLALWRLDRLSCRRILFAAERSSPAACERVLPSTSRRGLDHRHDAGADGLGQHIPGVGRRSIRARATRAARWQTRRSGDAPSAERGRHSGGRKIGPIDPGTCHHPSCLTDWIEPGRRTRRACPAGPAGGPRQ